MKYKGWGKEYIAEKSMLSVICVHIIVTPQTTAGRNRVSLVSAPPVFTARLVIEKEFRTYF